MKIVGAIFEKIKIFNFFLHELSLILGVGGKLKKKKTVRDIYNRTLDIEFEGDRSIGLGSTIGDGQTHTNKHKHKQTKTKKKHTHTRARARARTNTHRLHANSQTHTHTHTHTHTFF